MRNEPKFHEVTGGGENILADSGKPKKTPEAKSVSGRPYFEERENSCVYLGVEVPKGKGGELVPNKSAFENYFLTKEDYLLRRDIATSLALNKPLLMEGGTGIGKTSAVAQMCSDLDTNYCKVAFGRNTAVEDVIGNKDVDIVDGQQVFRWHDGKLLKAIREGGVAFLDEYNFQGSKIAGHVNPIIDAILNGYKTVSIPENNHEQVKVHPDFRLLAAQNPPGSEEGQEFPGREVLGAETFGRWTFQKLPLKMSKEMRLNRRLGAMGKKIDIEIADSEFRFLGSEVTGEELIDIPGMEHWAEKSVEIIEMLENKSSGAGKDMAKDQRQKLSFNPRLDQAMDRYVAKFYRGDVNQVWSDALEYFLVNMYKDEIDKEKVREAIRQSYYIPPKTESKRQGLKAEPAVPDEAEAGDEATEKTRLLSEIEAVKGEVPDWLLDGAEAAKTGATPDTKLPGKLTEQLRTAKEIMGATEFMGPIEVEQAYGIKINPKEIQAIPFSEAELKQAKALGQFLVLRANKDSKGKPLTMKGMRQALLDNGYDEEKKGKITASADYGAEPFWQADPIELKWALTSKEVIPDSTSKNYVEQTEQLVKYTENEVFKGKAMPVEFKSAIEEFKKYCDKKFKGKSAEDIKKLIGGSDWQKYAEEISELKINQLTRQTPAEILYDIFIYYQNNNEKILEKTYAWSKRRFSGGALVRVGSADAGGARVYGWDPDGADGGLGASFSRSSS